MIEVDIVGVACSSAGADAPSPVIKEMLRDGDDEAHLDFIDHSRDPLE